MLLLTLQLFVILAGFSALGVGVSVTDQFDSLLTTTLRDIKPGIVDNIFNSMPFLKWLKSQKALELRSGGHEIAGQTLYGKNSTIKAYTPYEVLDTTPQEGHTIYRYPWKSYGGTISIDRESELKNSGDSEIVDLLAAKVFQAEESLRDELTTDLFTDASSDPAKKITPVTLIIDDGPTSTVGGLSGTTYSWWQNYQADVGAFATNLLNDMITAYNTASRGGVDFPDTIVASQGGYEYFERLAVQTGAYTRVVVDNAKTLELGFEVLRFKNARLFFDSGLATGVPATGDTMFFVNSKYTKLVGHKKGLFETTDFRPSIDQAARVAQILFFGNLITTNRRKNAVLHGIDAS